VTQPSLTVYQFCASVKAAAEETQELLQVVAEAELSPGERDALQASMNTQDSILLGVNDYAKTLPVIGTTLRLQAPDPVVQQSVLSE